MNFKIKTNSTEFLLGISKTEQLADWLHKNPTAIGICIVGRSNVGKSSFINAVFGNKTARVSKTPGRTREINIFSFELFNESTKETKKNFFLIDLPGYGHADVSKEMSHNWDQLMNTFFTYFPMGFLVINLQDARHPDQTSDREFYKFIQGINQPTILVLNKLDKLKTQKERAELQKIVPSLSKIYKWIRQMYFISAETKKGLPPVEEAICLHLLNNLESLEIQKK